MGALDLIRKPLAALLPRRQTIPPNQTMREQLAVLLKQSQTFPILFNQWQTAQGIPRPETIGTFEDFGRVFKREVWVYACVSRIAQAAADVPLTVVRKTRDGEEPLESHPLLDLLSRVNPFIGPAFFIETIFSNLELFGNAYIEKVRRTPTSPPVELYPLRPDRMKILPDAQRYIAGFLYEVNSRRIPLEATDVVHLKTYHPLDDYYGLSTLEAAAMAVENDLYAVGYNRSFFKNNATPAGVFVHEEPIKEDDLKKFQEEFDKRHKGVKQAQRLGFMSGKWTWLDIGLRQRDAQFIDGRKMNREEILTAFGVPPILVGLVESQFAANVREQLQIFWKVTMLPRLQRVESFLNERLAPDFGPDVLIRFDTTAIEALKEDENDRVTRARGLVTDGIISPNEGREMLGLEKSGDPAMDQVYVGLGRAPIGSTAPADGAAPKGKTASRLDPIARWHEFHQDVTILETPMAAQLASFFRRRREEVITRLHDAVLSQQLLTIDNGATLLKQRVELDQVIFNQAAAQEELARIAARHLPMAIAQRGQRLLDHLALRRSAGKAGPQVKDLQFNLENPVVIDFLRRQSSRFIHNITTQTLEDIRRTLAEGERIGESVNQLSTRISDVFEEAGTVRSLRIARTEIIGASNFGQWEAMQQSGVVQKKQWLSARDGQVRESHQALDAETSAEPVALGQPFDNGLMYPGDQAGPPEEIVNCRCVLLEVVA